MRAEEQSHLIDSLRNRRALLAADDLRAANISDACSMAEQLAVRLTAAFPANHHLQTNRRILWLCLCDELLTLNKSREQQRVVIERIADELTADGIAEAEMKG